MLQPSEKIQKRLDRYETIDSTEATAIERKRKRKRKRIKGAIAAVALIGITSGYVYDTQENRRIQEAASASVEIKGDALEKEYQDRALVFLDGFGKKNADILARYMGEAIQPVIDGQRWSINYDNAFLNPKEIAEEIIATAETQDVETLSLVGYSAGGNIALEVLVEILSHSDIDIQSLFLVSSPNGLEGLRDEERQNIETIESIGWIPDIEYSTPIRLIGEVALRKDTDPSQSWVENIENFIDTTGDVISRLNNDTLPGGWLMFDQVFAIQNVDIKKQFDTLASMPRDRIRPTVVYLGTAKPTYDHIVDDTKSTKEISDYADAANIAYLTYDVPGAVHTRIDISSDEYAAVVLDAKDDIIKNIEQQAGIAEHYRTINNRPGPLLR